MQDLAACLCYVIIELCCLVFKLYLIYGDSVLVAILCLDESDICLRYARIIYCDALCFRLADLASACGRTSDLPALLDDLAVRDSYVVIIFHGSGLELDLIYGSALLGAHLDAVECDLIS